ncbi:uncharacterized protein LOC120339341 isoform X1 [Styela clava]
MGNIVNTIQLCKTTKSLSPVFNYYKTRQAGVSKSVNMRRAVQAWESRGSGRTRSNSQKRMMAKRFNARWPGQRCSYNVKSTGRTTRATYESRSRLAKKSRKNICNGRMRTPSQQAIIDRRKLHDKKDTLLKKFKIKARDSPSTRCKQWVRNIPPSSTWVREHTLSGHDMVNMTSKKQAAVPSQRHKKKKSRHRLTEKSSQRSLLMKRIMQKKMNMLKNHVQKNQRKHKRQRKSILQKVNPAASAGKFDVEKLNRRTLSNSCSEDSYEMRRKAAQVVRKVWSQPVRHHKAKKCSKTKNRDHETNNKGKLMPKRSQKYKMWMVDEAHKAHEQSLTNLGYKSLQLRADNIVQTRSEEKRRQKQTMKKNRVSRWKSSFRKLEKRSKKTDRKLKKIRHWMKEKTKNRPKCNLSKKIYVRKHRPGLFISREKKKPSLAWAILQSIKLLEEKGIPYPLAILKTVKEKWGQKELTLVELNDALKWMAKKGILKSNPTKDRENTRYSVADKQKSGKEKKKVSFKKDDSSTDLDRDDRIAVKEGVPRIRFQHGNKEFTSVKCRKYGSEHMNTK